MANSDQLSAWALRFKEPLKEADAQLFEQLQATYSSLLGDAELPRCFPELSPDAIPDAIDYLNTVTSVKNSVPCKYVDNPMANGEVYEGRWRQAFIRRVMQGEVTKLVQVLRRGWAEQINWDEARLMDGDNQPLQPERMLRVQFVNLNYAKLGEMIDGIETTKYYINPTIAGEIYDGPPVGDPPVNADQKWRVLSARPSRADDGSGVITLTLAKNLIMTPDELPAAILVSDDKALSSPFAHDTTSLKNAYVWEYRWIDPDYAQELRDTIALLAGVIDAKVVKDNDGTCKIQVLTQTNTWKGDLSQVWEHHNNFPTFAANQVVDTFSHVPLNRLTEFKATLATATSGYKVSSLVDSTAEEGFARIVRTQDKLFVGAVTADNGVRIDEEAFFLLTSGVIRTTMWLGVADADLDSAMTTLLTAPTGYTALRVGNNYNGTGSCNITRTMLVKGTIDDKIQVGIEYPSFEGERITYHYPGLDLETAKELYLSLQTEVVVGYKTDSVTIVESRMALTVVHQLSKVQVTPFETSSVHQQSYIHAFGLVTRATTVYLNVPFADIDTVKTAINALPDIIVLDISDDDHGTGSANVTYTWRTKETEPRSLGAVKSTKNSRFHKEEQDRLWIDVNLTDKDALAEAVALAMAGTAPYAVNSGAEIRGATGEDAGDKTGNIIQRVVVEGTPDPADYSMQESFNPHGLEEATMLISVREYPEVDYENVGAIFTLLQDFLGDPMKGRIQVSLNANGTFMMRALKEGTPDWDNDSGAGVQVSIQNPGLIGEVKTELATGVPVASAAELVASATADADYALTSIQMTERDNGEAVVEKTQTHKSETAVQVSETPALGARRAQKDYTWPLVLNANVASIWAAAATEGVIGNYVLHFRQKDFVGGMYRISSQFVEVVETTIADYTASYSDDSVTTINEVRDADDLPDATDTISAVVTVRGGLNLFNKYDYVLTTVTARAPRSCPALVTWDVLGDVTWDHITTFYSGQVAERNWLSLIRQIQKTYTHSLSYHLTASEAAVAISGGQEGSHISNVKDNLWQAHKVTYVIDVLSQIILGQPKFIETEGKSIPPLA